MKIKVVDGKVRIVEGQAMSYAERAKYLGKGVLKVGGAALTLIATPNLS